MTDIPTAITDRGQSSRFPARGGRLRRIVAATGLLAALTVTVACGGAAPTRRHPRYRSRPERGLRTTEHRRRPRADDVRHPRGAPRRP